MTGRQRMFRAVSSIFLLALLLAGASLWSIWAPSQGVLQRIRNQGFLRIGYANEAPYSFLDSSGRVTGESPEIARVVCSRLQFGRIEWCLTEFGALIDGLRNEQFDVIAAGLFITPERSQKVQFSHPTISVRSAFLFPKSRPLVVQSYAQLPASEIRLAVLSHSFEEEQLLQFGMRAERLIRVPDARTGLALVLESRVDGLALSAPTLRWMARQQPALCCGESSDDNPSSLGAFAFRPSDVELRDAWNGILQHYVNSAEHRALASRFGIRENELP